MEKKDLEFLFKKYLLRNPSDREYVIHLNKKYNEFENELLNCNEYLSISKNPFFHKKIALVISGHVRKHHIINSLKNLKGYNFDVFVHTWDNYGIKGQETNLDDSTDYEGILNIIKSIPNLVSFKIENNKKYLSTINDDNIYFNYSSPEKFIKSQLYSIWQSFEIFDEYKQENKINYDLVVKLRFDLYIESFILDQTLIDDVNNYKIIFAPNDGCGHVHPDSNSTTCKVCDEMYYKYNFKNVHSFDHSHVMCDLFAYGSYESMKKYMSIYNKYNEINESFVEDNLKKLEEYNITYTKENNVYLLERNQSGHMNSLFYINCSYPERILQKELKDFLIPSSKKINVKFYR